MSKNDRLIFSFGNIDNIHFPPNFFDIVIAIDTLYMPNNLYKTIERIIEILKSSGQFAAFYTKFYDAITMPMDEDSTDLAQVLSKFGVKYQSFDFNRENHELLCRKNKVAKELKDMYLREGNDSLYQKVLGESLGYDSVYNEKTNKIKRYLYHVKKN